MDKFCETWDSGLQSDKVICFSEEAISYFCMHSVKRNRESKWYAAHRVWKYIIEAFK